MVSIKTITCTFHENNTMTALQCKSDNLPVHIKGIAQWYENDPNGPGYYIPKKFSPTGANEPIEFINNQWFGLFTATNIPGLHTSIDNAIEVNTLGLGYWDISEHQHPQHLLHGTIPASTVTKCLARKQLTLDQALAK
jgi:hypothetical protein